MTQTARVPGSRLVRAGGVLFAVGVLAVAGYVLPYFLGHHRPVAAFMFVADLAPVGFGMALVGVYLQVRAQRRRVRG